MRMKLFLRYDDRWIAEGEGIKVSADTLEELDKVVESKLREMGYKGEIEVYMEFDYSTIPQWIRQFHPHYFNRSVTFRID